MTFKACLACAGALALSSAAGAVTYAGSTTIDGLTANISVTTDGTLGAINAGNIIAYSMEFTDGVDSFFADNLVATLTLTEDLLATASQLILPFPAAYDGNHEFGIRVWGFQYYFAVGQGSVYNSAYAETINWTGVGNISRAVTGDYVIGSAAVAPGVPEPASWVMMIAGLALSGAALRRRSARVAFAG